MVVFEVILKNESPDLTVGIVRKWFATNDGANRWAEYMCRLHIYTDVSITPIKVIEYEFYPTA